MSKYQEKFSKEQKLELVKRLHDICFEEKRYNMKDLCTEITKWVQDESPWNHPFAIQYNKFRRILKEPNKQVKNFSNDDYEKSYAFLEAKGLRYTPKSPRDAVDGVSHILYHALKSFIDVKEQSEDKSFKRLSGVYKVYCESHSIPTMFLIGMAEIEVKEGALLIELKFVNRGGNSDAEEVLTIEYDFEGYAIRKSNRVYLLMKKVGDNSLHTAELDYSSANNEQVVTMRGVLTGRTDNDSFTSKLYFERYRSGRDNLAAKMDIYDRKEVPKIVQNYLLQERP